MQCEYVNPDTDLDKRPFYPQDCSDFNLIIEKIHVSFAKASNPVYYCMSCHSIETRHSIDFHGNCKIAKKSEIFGMI